MEKKTFTVAQQNILNRGDFTKRYQQFIEIPKVSESDVVLIEEALDLELLNSKMEEVGFTHHIYSEVMVDKNNHSDRAYCGIFTKVPLMINETFDAAPYKDHFTNASIRIGEKLINLFAAHLEWGSTSEQERLRQVEAINWNAEEFEKKNSGESPITILGGDFNSDENSRTHRYLQGLDLNATNDASTLWVDSFIAVGKKEFWVTTDHGHNKLGRGTAKKVGLINPEFIPKRRIDYLYSKNWCYGKSGCPVDFGYLSHPSGEDVSDHNGIWAEFLL